MRKHRNYLVVSIISVIMLYMAFTPLFYVTVINSLDWLFVALRMIRTIAIIIAGLIIRKQYSTTKENNKAYNRNVIAVVLICSLVYLVAFVLRVPDKLYGISAGMLGIYN